MLIFIWFFFFFGKNLAFTKHQPNLWVCGGFIAIPILSCSDPPVLQGKFKCFPVLWSCSWFSLLFQKSHHMLLSDIWHVVRAEPLLQVLSFLSAGLISKSSLKPPKNLLFWWEKLDLEVIRNGWNFFLPLSLNKRNYSESFDYVRFSFIPWKTSVIISISCAHCKYQMRKCIYRKYCVRF